MEADGNWQDLSKPAPNAQTLWERFLWRGWDFSVPGLLFVGAAALAEELGWKVSEVKRCFAELEARGMAVADWRARVIWIPNRVLGDQPRSINNVKSWGTRWPEIPECALKRRAYDRISEYCAGRGRPYLEAFKVACKAPDLVADLVPNLVQDLVPDKVPNSPEPAQEEQKTPSSASSASADAAGLSARRVFDLYLEIVAPSNKHWVRHRWLDDELRQSINARLKERSEHRTEDFWRRLFAYVATHSAWLNRRRGLDFIVRSQGQLRRWSEEEWGSVKPPEPQRTISDDAHDDLEWVRSLDLDGQGGSSDGGSKLLAAGVS